jgi:carbon-monoxide dehydrogenase medium subunit
MPLEATRSRCRLAAERHTIAAMLLSEVGYARPATLEQALGVLVEHPGARALAGGQTLLNVMKARATSPDVLVDLGGIPELRGIELGSDGTLELGPMTTYAELIASAEARARPILGEVCAQIADVQVRNRGTIGGNVCASDPTNHLPPVLVALGAELIVAGTDGERAVPAKDFFLGVYMTAAGPGELLTKIRVPPGRSDGFASVPIGKDGTCIVNAAASLNGGLRVALGCVGAVPVVVDPESADGETVRGAVRGAGLDPPSDVHASADYRRHLAEVVAARAVEQASGRAG